MLERLPSAEIGGEGEGPDKLGRAERLLSSPGRPTLGHWIRRIHGAILSALRRKDCPDTGRASARISI
jgi:hypothetical protein